jgi:hypothetical protein
MEAAAALTQAAGKLSGLAERLHPHALTSRPRITVAEPISPRPFLQPRPARIRDSLSIAILRRSRPITTAAADAPRQICRGRAPPLASTPFLFTAV